MSTNLNLRTLGDVEEQASLLIKEHPKSVEKLFAKSPDAFLALAIVRTRGVQGAAQHFEMSRQAVYRTFSGLWKEFGLWSPRAQKGVST